MGGSSGGGAAAVGMRMDRKTYADMTNATIGSNSPRCRRTRRRTTAPASSPRPTVPVAGAVRVRAVAEQDASNIVTAGGGGGSAGVAASGAVTLYNADTQAYVTGSRVTAQSLAVAASSTNGLFAATGAGDMGGAAGVGTAFDVRSRTTTRSPMWAPPRHHDGERHGGALHPGEPRQHLQYLCGRRRGRRLGRYRRHGQCHDRCQHDGGRPLQHIRQQAAADALWRRRRDRRQRQSDLDLRLHDPGEQSRQAALGAGRQRHGQRSRGHQRLPDDRRTRQRRHRRHWCGRQRRHRQERRHGGKRQQRHRHQRRARDQRHQRAVRSRPGK